jgi:hypothetical protein
MSWTMTEEHDMGVMLKFELRVKMPHGGEQKVIVQATNRKNAEAMAEAQTGGKVMGGRQLPS